VVEAVLALDRAPKREVSREEDVGPVQCREQKPARRPEPDSGHLRQDCLDLLVGHSRQRFVAEPPVDEAFGERPERLALASREAGVAQNLWVGREELLRRRHVAVESLLEVPDDRSGRGDRQLLPATWKTSVPKASSGGSSSVQARGRKSGRSSIRRASTGSVSPRNSRAFGSASGERLRGRLSTLISRS
jgi:hypothetical protein